jgi:putative dimethyl sulfoxide reductase chaperone
MVAEAAGTRVRVAIPPTPAAHLTLLCDVVAGVFAPPSAGLRTDVEGGGLQEALGALAGDRHSAPALPTLAWHEVQRQHTALFVSSLGGIAAPPYVGYALDNELLGPSAEGLKRFLAHHGVTPAPGWGDLADHLAAVAEAAALLIRAGRVDAGCLLVTRFLSPWFERFTASVQAADDSGFYGALCEFLRTMTSEVACEAQA